MKKRIFAGALAALMMTLALAGCGDKPADTAPEAPAKPKRARVRIAASPVKVGSSKL